MKVRKTKVVKVASLDAQNNDIEIDANQSVEIEREEDGTLFASVMHDGHEIPIRLDNLESLSGLIIEAIEEFKSKL